ncbi:MAG: nucleotidyltransferase family protein [Actinomycetes bacterium]
MTEHTINPRPSQRAALLAQTLRADLAAAELLRALADAEVDAILLRGPVVARALYPGAERSYADSDVLVGDDQREVVEATLDGLGYRRLRPSPFEQHWRRSVDQAEIDLHRKLWGCNGPPGRLWHALKSHRVPFQLQGATISAPDEPALALVLALHASQHGTLFSRPLGDLERAVERFDSSCWHRAAALALEVGALLAFRQGLSMVPAGVTLLHTLSLEPAMSVQAVLRKRGVEVPFYLYEGLSGRERLAFLRLLLASAGDDDGISPGRGNGSLRAVRNLVLSAGARLRWYAKLVPAWRSARGEAASVRRSRS